MNILDQEPTKDRSKNIQLSNYYNNNKNYNKYNAAPNKRDKSRTDNTGNNINIQFAINSYNNITIKIKNEQHVYIGEITQNMVNIFQYKTMQEFRKSLEEASNGKFYEVDLIKLVFTVFAKNRDLLQVKLLKMKIDDNLDNRNGLQNIIKLCNSQPMLLGNHIKECFRYLSNYLMKMPENVKQIPNYVHQYKGKEDLGNFRQDFAQNYAKLTQKMKDIEKQIETVKQICYLFRKMVKVEDKSFQKIAMIEDNIKLIEKQWSNEIKKVKKDLYRITNKLEDLQILQKIPENKLPSKISENKKNQQQQKKLPENKLPENKLPENKLPSKISKNKKNQQQQKKQPENKKIQEQPKKVEKYKKAFPKFQTNFTISEKDLSFFRINGNIVERLYSKNGEESSQISGNFPFTEHKTYKILAIFSKSQSISVGIKDALTQTIIRYGGNGWAQNSGVMIFGQGKGIENGNIVEISVDYTKKEVTWRITDEENKQIYKCSALNQMINKDFSFWVPYLRISATDIIQIL